MKVAVTIDVCTGCQGFWFDKYESLKLSPSSTLKLMKLIGENPPAKLSVPGVLHCPRCRASLVLTKDLQRNTRFFYWRCAKDHGRFIRFFEFLREKNFIRPLSPQQIDELRQSIPILNCSSCGAPIDLSKTSACAHCGSAISMLDMKQPQQLMEQLKKAGEPVPVDPALPLELARARRDVEYSFRGLESGSESWIDASAANLVQAGLSAVAKWLSKSGI